jgi:hypothetical protein
MTDRDSLPACQLIHASALKKMLSLHREKCDILHKLKETLLHLERKYPAMTSTIHHPNGLNCGVGTVARGGHPIFHRVERQ